MKKLEILKKGEILFCKSCGTNIRAGSRWELYCPQCQVTENPIKITHVMSCTHCDQPLVIKHLEDSRIVGRCYTENCGDCFSMQDLTLIRLEQPLGISNIEYQDKKDEEITTSTILDNTHSIEDLVNLIKSMSTDNRLLVYTSELRAKSRELSKNDKEHSKVLNALLHRIEGIYPNEILRLTAWTWFD